MILLYFLFTLSPILAQLPGPCIPNSDCRETECRSGYTCCTSKNPAHNKKCCRICIESEVITSTPGNIPECCETKKNGDTIFNLVKIDEDIRQKYKFCKDGCIYEDTNEVGSRFCFKYGGEHNSTCDVGKIESVLTIHENGQDVEQKVIFNNYTEIIRIDVPPHVSVMQKNFSQATSTFDVKTKTNIIKSNSSCVLSDIPEYVNATGIPEYFQQLEEGTVAWDNDNKEIVYDINMIKSVVGPKERQSLTPALDKVCNNEIMKKTENRQISKDNYEKLINDEIIFLEDNSESQRAGCSRFHSCTKKAPDSCGNYGWYNPDLKRHISMHRVSSGSSCLVCCSKKSPSCNCTAQMPQLCPCEKIINKEMFMDCELGNRDGLATYGVPFQDSVRTRSTVSQLLTYNSQNDARLVKVHVPSHGDIEETTVVMHAASNGYWHSGSLANNMMMKVGSSCHIRTLPRDMFPVDIAMGIKEINAGNFTLTPENEKKKHSIIMNDGPLDSNDERNLNPEIKEICQNNEVSKSREIDVSETDFETLNNGGIIEVENNKNTRRCNVKTKATTNRGGRGCWRWQNPDSGKEIGVHRIVRKVIDVTCCKEIPGAPFDCCKTSDHCECTFIKDGTSFQRCLVPTKTDLKAQDSTGRSYSQTFNYNRTEGYLTIIVEAHDDLALRIESTRLEEATMVLYESQGQQLLKRGNSCYLLPLGERNPMKIAQQAAEIAKKMKGPLTSDMETVSTSILVLRAGEIPALPDDVRHCDGINITLVEEVPVEKNQFEDLNAGKIITLPQGYSGLSYEDSDELGKCIFQTKCASNSGNSCIRWPTSNTDAPPFYDHGLIATPNCLLCCIEGNDPNYCECGQITDMETFQQCLQKQEMVMVITGAYGMTEYNLVNRYIRNQNIPGLQLEELPTPASSNFPVKTSGGVGVWIDNRLIACQGTDGVKNGCYQMNLKTKSWTQGGDYEFLSDPLVWGGASAKYKSGPTGKEPGDTWWIIGGDPEGTRTQIWNSKKGVNPWKPPILPKAINTPCCMVAISDREVFVTGTPMYEYAPTNLAWIFSRDYEDNKEWKSLPPLREERHGAACGFLPNNGSGWIVVAGGYEKSSTEILDLNKCLDPKSEECAWVLGPELGGDFYGASIVTMSTEELVLFGDHTDILAINSTFANWEVVGQISQPRYSAVVLAID